MSRGRSFIRRYKREDRRIKKRAERQAQIAEKELKRWERKLKLFYTLHPGYPKMGCGEGKHECPLRKCPKRDRNGGTTITYDRKTRKMEYTKWGSFGQISKWCVEWIKHV